MFSPVLFYSSNPRRNNFDIHATGPSSGGVSLQQLQQMRNELNEELNCALSRITAVIREFIAVRDFHKVEGLDERWTGKRDEGLVSRSNYPLDYHFDCHSIFIATLQDFL